jgi:hypothetical protein
VTHIDICALSAGLAVPDKVLALGDDQIGLRVLARTAEDEFDDETVEKVSEFGSVMGAVYDIAIGFFVEGGLSTEFAAKEFCRVGRRTTEGPRNIGHVREDCLDTIALAFNFGEKHGHTEQVMRSMFSELVNLPLSPVAVKLVIDVATNINVLNTSHIGVISVCDGFRVRVKKSKLQRGGKTDDCGERQTTNGLL